MYEYVNGEKGNNIGFAKIASQNQRYKIKVHIKNFALNGKVLNVYGFVRGDGILYSSCLGSIKIINGIGEGIFVGNTGDLWEKYRFLDMSGLILCGASLIETGENDGNVDKKTALLQQENARFCATQWKEGTIVLEQLDIFQGQKKGNVINTQSERRNGYKTDIEMESQAVMETGGEKKTLQAAETYSQYQTDRKGGQGREVSQSIKGFFDYQNQVNNEKAESEMEPAGVGFMENVTEENKEKSVLEDFVQENEKNGQRGVVYVSDRQMEDKNETLDSTINKNETVYSPHYEKSEQNKQQLQYIEKQVNQPLEAEQENFIQNPENNSKEEDIWDLFEQRRKQIQLQFEQLKQGTGTEIKDQINQGTGPEIKNQMEDKIKDATKWQPGEEILEKFPEMSPFFDNSVFASVRIEPKDIGALPMEFWYLANNSFLLHGYYCYRHLLFMKMEIGQEMVYAIAVPGNSNYREKFMANMFGFEHFKAVQKKQNAEFGYWWKRIF